MKKYFNNLIINTAGQREFFKLTRWPSLGAIV